MRSKLRTILAGASAALLAGAIAAIAANVTILTSIGDQVFPFGAPTTTAGGTIGDVARGGMAPLNGSLSYVKNVPLTGFSLTVGNFQADLALRPAATLATGTVILPSAPVDGHRFCISSTQTVTALTLTPGAGQTIQETITGITVAGPPAPTRICFLYSLANLTWNRIQ